MYQRLLVPIDGSTASNGGLAEAIELAQATGARLRLLHAVDTFVYGTGLDTSADSGDELFEPLRQAGAEVLDRGRQAAERAGVPVETQLFDDLKGDLADLVTNDALRWRADLIVLGTHGAAVCGGWRWAATPSRSCAARGSRCCSCAARKMPRRCSRRARSTRSFAGTRSPIERRRRSTVIR